MIRKIWESSEIFNSYIIFTILQPGGGSIKTQKCPKYADASCFTAAMWSDNEVNGEFTNYEEDHRGCSSFNFHTLDPDCQSGQNGENGHFAECKTTCNEDNCNTKKLEKRQTCITCTGTRHSDNSTVGKKIEKLEIKWSWKLHFAEFLPNF